MRATCGWVPSTQFLPKFCVRKPTKLATRAAFTIYDTQDSRTLIGQIVKELELDDKIYRPNAVLSRISDAKNKLISVAQYLQDAGHQGRRRGQP